MLIQLVCEGWVFPRPAFSKYCARYSRFSAAGLWTLVPYRLFMNCRRELSAFTTAGTTGWVFHFWFIVWAFFCFFRQLFVWIVQHGIQNGFSVVWIDDIDPLSATLTIAWVCLNIFFFLLSFFLIVGFLGLLWVFFIVNCDAEPHSHHRLSY